ncbi:MAG TPA: hypothetical protein VGG45_05985 [Terracidiphilus sp.]|jgi:hypothetical protein
MSSLAFLLQQGFDPDQLQKMMLAIVPIILVCVAVGFAIVIIPFWFICKKAGFSPWLSLLNIIPLGNLILIYVLAFAQWKVTPIPTMAFPPPYPPPQPPLPPQV